MCKTILSSINHETYLINLQVNRSPNFSNISRVLPLFSSHRFLYYTLCYRCFLAIVPCTIRCVTVVFQPSFPVLYVVLPLFSSHRFLYYTLRYRCFLAIVPCSIRCVTVVFQPSFPVLYVVLPLFPSHRFLFYTLAESPLYECYNHDCTKSALFPPIILISSQSKSCHAICFMNHYVKTSSATLYTHDVVTMTGIECVPRLR